MSEADAKIRRGEEVPWQRWQMTELDQRRRKGGSNDQPAGAKPDPAARDPRPKSAPGSAPSSAPLSEQGSAQEARPDQQRRGAAPGQRPAQPLAPSRTTASASAQSKAQAPASAKRATKGAAERTADKGGPAAAQPGDAAAALEAERKRVREAARKEGHAKGLKAGRTEGYAKGLEEGRKAAREELEKTIEATLKPVQHLAVHFSEALALLNDEMAKDLVELALATGRQLAGDALTASPTQVVDLVRGLLHSEPAMHGKPRLWLHPQDHDLVNEYLGKELKAAGWALQPDDQVSRGGCRVTSATGELDATWESRWQAVRQQVRSRRPASEQAAAAQALLDAAATSNDAETIKTPTEETQGAKPQTDEADANQ